MFSRRIYLDYASLTPIDPAVRAEMKKYSSSEYANPSSLHREGVLAKKALGEARKRVADFIHAHSNEIVFTSGGTEANGLAIEGVLRAARRSGIERPHLIVSKIEHTSIVETRRMIEGVGGDITDISAGPDGIINLEELEKAIKPTTVLISIMTVNNEIGTIQPIQEIAKIIRKAKKNLHPSPFTPYPLFHTDAAQAALYQDLYVEKLGVDLMTLDGHKICGPRGIGCLFIKRGTPIEPIIHGGGQERGMRSGTENIPAIMGFAKALDIAASQRESETLRISGLRKAFIEGLRSIRSDIIVNPQKAETDRQSPHILNISIPGIDNEFFILQLDAKGIACSTKSSCLRDEDESYVLKEIGADSRTSVRFSFGRWTREKDINKALEIIGRNLNKR